MFTSTRYSRALLRVMELPGDNDCWTDARITVKRTMPRDMFERLIEQITGYEVAACEDCDYVVDREDSTTVQRNGEFRHVCDDCRGRNYTFCEDHDEWVHDREIRRIGDRSICQSCAKHYTVCGYCGEYSEDGEMVNDDVWVCDGCIENYYTWCEQCEQYFYNSDSHSHACECEAPHREFLFPANGDGMIANDERLRVELPKGTIDSEGIDKIIKLVWRDGTRTYESHNGKPCFTSCLHWDLVQELINEIGPTWQAKRGNFTKRLSSALYKTYKIKLDADEVSEIGNLAKQHSDSEAGWYVEFTRELNGSAAAFGNSGSCWWQSYAASRCCLKSWGGIGLRSYTEGADRETPNGRVWVQPMRHDDDGDLVPTHDAANADAYVVYNGYGEMAGYTASRIVAHLTGKTYKKITFNFSTTDDDDVYTNGGSGYLVADDETCGEINAINLRYDAHDLHDADSVDCMSSIQTEQDTNNIEIIDATAFVDLELIGA